MNVTLRVSTIVLTILITAATLGAQDQTGSGQQPDFTRLQKTLHLDDTLIVTTDDGTKLKGSLLDLTDNYVTLRSNGQHHRIPMLRVSEVKQRKNGVLLGGLIGAAAGIPFGLFLGQLYSNEGGDQAIALLPIAVGMAAGIGIDYAISSTRTVYKRQLPRTGFQPLVAPGRVGVKFAWTF